MKKLFVLSVCVLLIVLCPTFAKALHQTATWTGGGDGISYCDDANWDIGIYPRNFGTLTFDAIIPPVGVTVNLDCSCEVTKLELGDNSRLKIPLGKDYIMDAGYIYGVVDADNGTFHVEPFYILGNRARAYAINGAKIAIGSGDPSAGDAYSSTGLYGTSGDFYHPRTHAYDLFNVTGIGTNLDLSLVQSINAGFNSPSYNDTIQKITASSSGKIDLSGVHTITAPNDLEDRLEFIISDNAVIDLSSLQTITSMSQGQTLFDLTNSVTLSLPELETVDQVRFFLDGGANVHANVRSSNYSSTAIYGTSGDFYHPRTHAYDLFNVTGIGTNLDLSLVQSINAGFNSPSYNDTIQKITASSSGKIDLSGVHTITAPNDLEDRLEFIISDNAVIDLFSLQTITSDGSGKTLFDIAGGLLVLGNLNPDSCTAVTATGVTSDPQSATLEVEGDVILNNPTTIVLSEATLKVGGNLDFSLTDEEEFKAADILDPDTINSIAHFDGSGTQTLEVGGVDVDVYIELLPNNNFGFGKLIVGQEGQPTIVRIQDAGDNGNGCKMEALYLFGLSDSDPNGLYIHEGSTLVLDGINVYALRDGEMLHINDLLAGQNEITYDGGGTIRRGIAACEGDFDGDGDVDGSDLAKFAADFGRTDCTVGNPCTGDFCNDGDVDGSDLANFAADFGRTDCPTSP